MKIRTAFYAFISIMVLFAVSCQKAFVNGNMIEIEDKVEGSCQCGENLFPNCDFVGFRACPVILVATKTRTGCPIYEYLTCPDCGAAYTGNIQDMEPALAPIRLARAHPVEEMPKTATLVVARMVGIAPVSRKR